MRILVTGAGGMLGTDLGRAAVDAGHEVVGLTRAELDIADRQAVAAVVSAAAPDVVVNCAAWTNVDGAEAHEHDALAVNGDGAGHVAAAARAAGAWTVQVSTDYVFDGRSADGYLESDPVGPLSAYGRSKLAGEEAVARAAPGAHTIVRTSWLFGAHGPCFPKTMLRLGAERDELGVVSDQVGCPTFTGDLARALVEIAERRVDGALHVAGSGSCSWWELARQILASAGVDCEVKPISTAEYPVPAPRPACSILRSERGAPVLPPWQDGLARFLSELSEVSA